LETTGKCRKMKKRTQSSYEMVKQGAHLECPYCKKLSDEKMVATNICQETINNVEPLDLMEMPTSSSCLISYFVTDDNQPEIFAL
jgi:hypothetical protein